MNDTVNQITHKLFNTPFFHHDYLNRLKKSCVIPHDSSLVVRVAQAALPLITSYGPLAHAANLGLNGLQATHAVYDLGKSLYQYKLGELPYGLLKLTLSVISLASAIFNHKIGNLITTASGLVYLVQELFIAAQKGDRSEIAKVILRLAISSCYLGIIITGSLELSLGCVLLHLSQHLFEALKEIRNGRYIEGICFALQAAIKIEQGHTQYMLLQKRNHFAKMERFAKLMQQLEKVRDLTHFDSNHPFMELEAKIEQNEVRLQNDEKTSMGSYFFGLGEDVVKGMNLEFQKDYAGSRLDFNINREKRSGLLQAINLLETMDKQDIQTLLQLFDLPITDIKVVRQPCSFMEAYKRLDEISAVIIDEDRHDSSFEFVELVFVGIGSLRLGASDEHWYMRTHAQIFLEAGRNLYHLHTALCLVGLDAVLRTSSQEALERMKIGHLFRVFYPMLAHELEITKEYFSLSIAQLKEQIIQKASDMQAIFSRYLAKMQVYEILPGKYRFQIIGLKEDMRTSGALGLTSSLSLNSFWNGHKAAYDFSTLISVLNNGMLATELRYAHELNKASGLSSEADIYAGGSDSVFTQMVTTYNKSYDEFTYQSNVRILIDLEAIESGSYQYPEDCFGMRRRDEIYSECLWAIGIKEFVSYQAQSYHFWGDSNEVMLKERIPPSWIKGLVLQDAQIKEDLIKEFRAKNIIQKDIDGIEKILGYKIDDFIHVDQKIDAKHFGF